MKKKEEKKPDEQNPNTETILGLSTSDLAGLTVDDIKGNDTAIKMFMHYYKRLVDENSSLKNDLNTTSTYVSGFEKKKTYSSVSTILLAISNILIGFGVNLLTTNPTWPGFVTFGSGVILISVGIYYSVKKV